MTMMTAMMAKMMSKMMMTRHQLGLHRQCPNIALLSLSKGHHQNYNGDEDDNDDKSIHITVSVVMYCTFCDKADVVADVVAMVADDDDDYNNAAHNM